MNIGEVSKPSVERSELGKKIDQRSTHPVTESKQVVDSAKLSDESKRRFKKKHKPDKILNKDSNKKNTKPSDSQPSRVLNDTKTPPSKGLNIDLRA